MKAIDVNPRGLVLFILNCAFSIVIGQLTGCANYSPHDDIANTQERQIIPLEIILCNEGWHPILIAESESGVNIYIGEGGGKLRDESVKDYLKLKQLMLESPQWKERFKYPPEVAGINHPDELIVKYGRSNLYIWGENLPKDWKRRILSIAKFNTQGESFSE